MRVVATAGHVDHGKSSLVLALTGTDPDRFPEEKARGLTIDLGFAFTTLPSGETVGFVDVPGHVKFVKNMLAGVGAVDVAILVVAATEGWMPQTEEHFGIVSILGIEHGVVVVTKAALVDDETLEIAQLELDDHLAGTPAAKWPVVVVDSPTGRGIDALKHTLDAVIQAAPTAHDVGRPRLWVDRAFAAKGSGTVVTGTLTGGSLSVDDEVAIAPHGLRARIRGLEAHHSKAAQIAAGSRVAVNLAGVDRSDVSRGDVLHRSDQWRATDAFDVRVLTLPGHDLPRRGRLAVHVGSGEHAARWRILDADGRFARIRLDVALPLVIGDRVVVRSTGRRATVGGGIVVDLHPARRTNDALARFALSDPERVLEARGWIAADDIRIETGATGEQAEADVVELLASGVAVRVGKLMASRAYVDRLRDDAVRSVRAHHREHPKDRGADLAAVASSLGVDTSRLRSVLEDSDALVVTQDVVRDRDHQGAAAEDPDGQRFLAALDAAPFNPPAPDELGIDPALVRALTRDGDVVNLDGVIFGAAGLARAHALVGAAVTERGTLTISEIRDLLGSTRKYVLPIVNWLDTNGITRRRGDDRIPGPRAIPG